MYSKIFKNIVILLFCIILFHPMIYAQEHTPNLFPRTTLDFCILESELSEENYVVGDMYDLGFIEYDNKKISNSRPIHDRMITLRSEFTIDSIYSTQDLYLVVLPVDYPCKIYINGDQLFIRGNYKNGYTNRMHCSENILLPPYKINYNDKNEIAFQLYPKEGESHPLGQVFISNSQDATKYVFYRNLLGTKLIFALSLCSFVFFVFFLIIYITRREYQKQYSLFFAFMNLFFIISFINNIFSYNFSNTF